MNTLKRNHKPIVVDQPQSILGKMCNFEETQEQIPRCRQDIRTGVQLILKTVFTVKRCPLSPFEYPYARVD
jgi:hypothetical protein